MTIRILVADDHKLFRQGLISLMLTHDDLVEVVGEAASGAEAVQMAASLKPDVVLMDIYMPDGDGLQATREICTRFPDIAVVMLTSSEDDEHLYEAVRLGASGYLLKEPGCGRAFFPADRCDAWRGGHDTRDGCPPVERRCQQFGQQILTGGGKPDGA